MFSRSCLVLAALVLAADVSLAEKGKKKPAAPTAAGTVKAVDAAANTITLQGSKSKKGDTPEQSFSVGKDAKITVDGQAKALADIKAGAQAYLVLSDDKKAATAINVNGGSLSGTVKSVDAAAGKVSLEGRKSKKGEAGPDVELAVARDAKVIIDGEAKSLGDIKAGAVAHFVLATDKKTALGVVVGSSKKKGKPGVPTAAGEVKGVDATAGTITLKGLKSKKGEAGPERKFEVARDARVTIEGEAKALADVKAGAKATLTLSADKKSVTAITVGGKPKKKKGE